MYQIITNPARTLDEALARTHEEILKRLRDDALLYAMELGKLYFEAGAAWAAACVRAEAPTNDRRAPSLAAEKIIAQVCPPEVSSKLNG